MPTTIQKDQRILTLVNVFTVPRDRQQALIDLLTEATTQVMHRLPGFVSANLHKSLDGTKVVNYAQWQSKADFEAMLRHPDARQHMDKAAALAKAEPVLYEVAYVDHA